MYILIRVKSCSVSPTVSAVCAYTVIKITVLLSGYLNHFHAPIACFEQSSSTFVWKLGENNKILETHFSIMFLCKIKFLKLL